ncbi:hypothetical protein GWC77_19615 [Paraburkholderia sp. NMBU_R16]|nr:hypothetical protein [Paraburkholderia sp. NMBU_R16]
MASLETTQLLNPPQLGHLDAEERREYLRRLFFMDVRLLTFVVTARSLGFGVTCHWNHETSMPHLVWLH